MQNATDTTLTPVTEWENRSVKGQALVSEHIYQEDMARVEKLRAREAAYRASMPVDPKGKCDAIRKLWIDDDYYSRGYMREAQAIAFALESMVKDCDPENVPEERDAMRWFTDRLIECQRAEYGRIEKAMDILRPKD